MLCGAQRARLAGGHASKFKVPGLAGRVRGRPSWRPSYAGIGACLAVPMSRVLRPEPQRHVAACVVAQVSQASKTRRGSAASIYAVQVPAEDRLGPTPVCARPRKRQPKAPRGSGPHPTVQRHVCWGSMRLSGPCRPAAPSLADRNCFSLPASERAIERAGGRLHPWMMHLNTKHPTCCATTCFSSPQPLPPTAALACCTDKRDVP